MAGSQLPFGVVANPSSAFGRGRRVALRVHRRLARMGLPAVAVSGRDPEECLAALRAAVDAGVRGLVLVGGDGLIGLVLQEAAARNLPIGVVPAGSGNDFARQYALPRRPGAAIRRILSAERSPRLVDLGVARLPGEGAADGSRREHFFAGGLSVGLDAAVNRRANAMRLPLGPFKYHLALLAEIAALRLHRFTVDLPDERAEFTGILTTAMNIRAIGGGIPLAPRALSDDGMLDLVIVSRGTRLRIMSVLLVLAAGRHERLPEVRIVRTPHVRIETADPETAIAYADGERVGRGPFEISVEPGALKLLA